MKRNLIALAATGLVLGANAALADSTVFTDSYWKLREATFAQSTASTQDQYQTREDQLTRYNP